MTKKILSKTLTVGTGAALPPAQRTGVAATQKESVDKKVKMITWTTNDLNHFSIKDEKIRGGKVTNLS